MDTINYYKKYLKYKEKYLKLLSKNKNLLGGNFNIIDYVQNMSGIIEINNFNNIDEVINTFRDIYDPTKTNIRFEELIFVRNNNNNVVGIKINRPLTPSEINYIRNTINDISINFITPEASEEIMMKEFFKDVNENPEKVKNYIRRKYPNRDKAFEFIKNYTNKNDTPSNKNLMYYAVRTGNLNLLYFVLDYLGEDRFRELMTVRDEEGRTLFMIATHAAENIEGVFNLILHHTPVDYIFIRDVNKRNALDWFEYRGMENENVKKKLEEIFASK